jgi:hypothetical protein
LSNFCCHIWAGAQLYLDINLQRVSHVFGDDLMHTEEGRARITEIAETFLSLGPEARQVFLTKLAESGNPEAADWLSIFQAYNK